MITKASQCAKVGDNALDQSDHCTSRKHVYRNCTRTECGQFLLLLLLSLFTLSPGRSAVGLSHPCSRLFPVGSLLLIFSLFPFLPWHLNIHPTSELNGAIELILLSLITRSPHAGDDDEDEDEDDEEQFAVINLATVVSVVSGTPIHFTVLKKVSENEYSVAVKQASCARYYW